MRFKQMAIALSAIPIMLGVHDPKPVVAVTGPPPIVEMAGPPLLPSPPPPKKKVVIVKRPHYANNINGWIKHCVDILKRKGIQITHREQKALKIIAYHESGFDPGRVNKWDSNYAAGTPSKGLCQTIKPTFDAFALPGHTDIWNPVDNLIAAYRYSVDRYGSINNVPGVVSVRAGMDYIGY